MILKLQWPTFFFFLASRRFAMTACIPSANANFIHSSLSVILNQYTQSKIGASTTSIWSPQINRYRYNDALQKHESNGSLTWWRHRFLRHCRRSLARRYISIIFVYTLPRLRTSNVNRTNKRNGFRLRKARSRRYPAENMTKASYEDDLALLVNRPDQVEYLLHVQNKVEFMCFKREVIFTLRTSF